MADIEKVDLASENLVDDRLDKLKELMPEVFTESGVDFDKLRLELGDEIDEGQERYAFTWPGKADAIRQSQTVSTATLRPCVEKSRGHDGKDGSFDSDNIYIEGDNLEVLKLLQRGYHGKVKMIYIDPPYNTGNDFVYHDSFGNTIENYKQQAGLALQSNADASGRYHSDWCSMIYPRLRLARELLSEDGVIFISIDNNEVKNARSLCDEIFGENCFIAQFVWEKKKKGSFLSKSVSNVVEFILCYCRDSNRARMLIGEVNSDTETYPCINAVNGREIRTIPAGIASKYKQANYTLPKGSVISNSTMNLVLHSDLVLNAGRLAEDLVIEGNWRYSQDAMTEYAKNGELYVTQDLYLRRIVNDERQKTMKDLLPRVGADANSPVGSINVSNLFESGWGSNEDADEELRVLMGTQKLLDYPKPVVLISKLICASGLKDDDIVLDFFSGSATTAHSVMKTNVIKDKSVKYLLVQLPEQCDEKSVAKKAGFDNLCQLGEERIRRAGDKIKDEIKKGNAHPKLGEEPRSLPDIGFRVFSLDDSGIERPEPGQLVLDVVKPDRTELDIVFEMMLKWGLELTLPVEKSDAASYPIWSVACDELVCCMSRGLTIDALEAIADMEPRRVLILDSILDDTLKLNAVQIFKHAGERMGCEIELRTV